MCENYTESGRSDNSCSINVRKYPHSSLGAGQAKAFTKGLRRRDLTAAFITRFHSKYKRSDGCWLWLAGRYPRGYGMVNLGRNMRGRQFTTYAHRVSYLLAHGEIPVGAVVMHICDVPACVNPAHLQLGTQGDNVRDCYAKGRHPITRHRRLSA